MQPNEHSVDLENIAEKKKAILESTLKLIKENGFHGTPMSMVAKNAGCAAGTIYHYFESKDTLILELYFYVRKRVVEAMFRDDKPEKDYKERFFNFWINQCRFYISNPDILYFIEQYLNSPYNQKNAEVVNEVCRDDFKAFLESGVEQGILKSMNKDLVKIIAHSSAMTTSKVYLSGKINMKEKEIKEVAEVVWDGLKKSGD